MEMADGSFNVYDCKEDEVDGAFFSDNDEVFGENGQDVLDLSSMASAQPSVKFCTRCSFVQKCFCSALKRVNSPSKHPPPLMIGSPTTSSSPLVTLQSLSIAWNTRDSGYEPSPTSMASFTFSSDDEYNSDILTQGVGTTSPINIPTNDNKVKVKQKKKAELTADFEKSYSCGGGTTQNVPSKPSTGWLPLRRSKSLPHLWMLSGAQLFRQDNDSDCTPVIAHGRFCSLPAKTPDGRALLSNSGSPVSHNLSEVIDLTEDGQGGNNGHRRRVLVLDLPDLVIDVERNARPSTPPEDVLNPLVRQPSSSSSMSGSEVETNKRLGRLYTFKGRPAWRRSRALSCDVTCEVMGRELRKIADEFKASREAGPTTTSVWRYIQNGLRRFSYPNAEDCPPMIPAPLSHSLPAENYLNMNLS